MPFLVPLAWLMMAWPCWLLAARLTRRSATAGPGAPWSAAYVFAAWDVVLDPQMVQAGLLDAGRTRTRGCPASAPCR